MSAVSTGSGYFTLFQTVRKAVRLIRQKDMNLFRLAEDGVFDPSGALKDNSRLDEYTFYGSAGEKLVKIENHRVYLDFPDIPETVKTVLLNLEDERFYHHIGVDLIGLMRAALNNLRGGGRQGASTITMQLVKMLFLPGYRPVVKYKLLQIFLALVMERYFTKDQILELYVNTIYLANHIYGMGAAARYYFNKPVRELSVSECTYLATISMRPAYNDPRRHPEHTEHYRQLMIRYYLERGMISRAEYDAMLEDVPAVVPREQGTGGTSFDEIYTVGFSGNKKRFSPAVSCVYNRLKDAGFSDPVIAGILGNIHVESGFDPECANYLARGLCQWNGERVERLKRSYPDTYLTSESQTDFLLSECDPASPNADPETVKYCRLVREDSGRTVEYYSDLFQALVERNQHQDHYENPTTVSNPDGVFYVYDRMSMKPNAYDGLFYLDAPRRRNYSKIYYECIRMMRDA